MEIVKDIVFNALAILFFGAVLYSVWAQSPGSGTVAVFAAVFCTLMGNADRFETVKFSLTGVETKAREVLRQAEVTQKAFQKLAAMTGELLIDLNAAQGRFAGSGEGEARDARKSRLLESLGDIGLSKQDLAKVADSDKAWNIIDYANGILTSAGRKIPDDRRGQWQAALAPIMADGNFRSATPEKLRDLLAEFAALDTDQAELIDDYRHYLKTGEQRRPDIWMQRYKW